MRRAPFLAVWLSSALAVGAGTGFGILQATRHTATAAAAPVAAQPTPAPTPTPRITSGVRADGTHYGSLRDLLLPMPPGFRPGPDDTVLGNDSDVTPQQMDSQFQQLLPGMHQSDLTSAKGVMEAAHMKGGALRTYAKTDSGLDIEFAAFQLDSALAAKSTSDLARIIDSSGVFRSGPAVAGHADARCVLPPTLPGDKLDEMVCFATVGDTLVFGLSQGVVPLDQKAIIALFGEQLDLFKNGLEAK